MGIIYIRIALTAASKGLCWCIASAIERRRHKRRPAIHLGSPPPPISPTESSRVKMASTSFRDSMNSMGWSRREADLPASTNSSTPILSRLQALNPFGDAGYVRLPTHEGPGAPLPAPSRREEDEGFFAREYYKTRTCFVSSLR